MFWANVIVANMQHKIKNSRLIIIDRTSKLRLFLSYLRFCEIRLTKPENMTRQNYTILKFNE